MSLQILIFLTAVFSICSSIPVIRQQIGIIASNSNEILRVPGLTLTGVGGGVGQPQVQGTTFLSPFLIQQQPELLLPQIMNFGPQIPFLPQQQNQPPVYLTPLQNEQPAMPANPSNTPNQDPAQVMPQFYPYLQGPGGQGFPYYLNYGFPPRNTFFRPQPNLQQAVHNPVSSTKGPQLVQNNGNILGPWRMTPPPDNRGDLPGRAVDGDSVVPFFLP